MNSAPAPARLFTPAAFFGAMALLAAFGCGLFFGGLQDVIFAPAVAALLLFSLLAVLPGCWRGMAMPSSYFAFAMFAFWLYITLSLLWSTVPFASLVTYLIALVLPLTFFSLLLTQDRVAWLSFCGAMIGLAMLCLAFWAILQITLFPEMFYRAHHPLPNPNSLAILLNLGLCAVLPLFIVADRLDAKAWAALAAALLLAGGMMATESRGALLALLVVLPLMFWLLRASWKRIMIVLAALGLLFAAMQAVTGGHMIHRIAHMAADNNPENTLEARIALWDSAYDMALEKPLTGTGLGTFYLYYPAHRKPLVDNSAGGWVHNDPLQFAVEMGVGATALFYLILILGVARTFAALKHEPHITWRRVAIVGPFCALITLTMAAHISFPFYLIPITLVAGLLLAVWYEATMRALPADKHDKPMVFHGWQQPFMAAMALLIAAMITLMAFASAAGMFYLQQARAALEKADIENFLLLADKADRLSPPSFIDAQVQIAAINIDLLVPPGGLMLPHEQVALRDQTLQLLANAEALNPGWAEINFKRGRLYAVTGVYELTSDGAAKAAAEYRIAITKNPMHYRAREELAKILAAQGNAAAAYDILRAGLEYPLPNAIHNEYLPLMRQLESLAAVQKQYIEEQDRE